MEIVIINLNKNTMADQHTYQVKLNWIEDRKGILQSDVLNSKIEVVTPPEFPIMVSRTSFCCGCK